MTTWSRPTVGHEYSPDEYRNIMHSLRYEACEDGPTCVHSDDPYSMKGTAWHYETCPANPDYEPVPYRELTDAEERAEEMTWD